MNPEPLSSATNPDLVNSLIALRRAARMAREVAVKTDTDIVLARDGKLVRITAEEIRGLGVPYDDAKAAAPGIRQSS